jgi:hypothetical protein
MAMTARGGQDDGGHPFVIDGVRHDSGCELFRHRAFPAEILRCDCGALGPEGRRHAAAVERERIACLLERVDNSMLDQAKLAAYVRGQETP